MELVMSVNGLQLNISSLAISNYAMQCGYQSYCVNSGKPQAFICSVQSVVCSMDVCAVLS